MTWQLLRLALGLLLVAASIAYIALAVGDPTQAREVQYSSVYVGALVGVLMLARWAPKA